MRRSLRAVPVLALAGLALLAAACGDDDEPGASSTPGTATAATATPGTLPQPTSIPLKPTLPAGVRALGSGYRTFSLKSGVGGEMDTLQAARDAGIVPPACAGFVFSMHWSVDGPGARLAKVESVIQGTAAEVGTGAEGRATVGCSLLRFSAPDTAFLNVAYLIGTTE